MDNLYGDLENYNEVNVIEELRQENEKLKLKLKELTSSMDKLQKEFDDVASKHKVLEKNYSSLLITARAEVERKTQIISSLNIEKDTMVLNSVQNSTKNILNIRRNVPRDSFKRENRRDDSSEFGKKNKNDLEISNTKKRDTDRAEDNRMASIDTVSSVNTDETNKEANIENKPGKKEGYAHKNNDGKENITKVTPRAQSIRNRRKSMPAVSKQYAKFSSDEEFEGHYSGGEAINKDWPARDDKNRRTFGRAYHEKLRHKVSETSGIDDKYSSYHESSRETNYKGKPNKYIDRYRSRDKYDPSQRHRRHLSPARQQRRSQRDYSDERLQRSEYGRHRVLESPPPDRYDTQCKSRDRRSNYEREYHYEEKQRYRQERHAIKQKNLSDYDEPTSKRIRRESYGRPLEEDVRWHTEIDHAEDPAISKMIEDYHTSCQSPDYILSEALNIHTVKEIMNTATTQLDDPRITSKKYVANNEDGKVVLSTLTARNVDLKVIDTSTWEIERVDVPDALRRPPQDTDELVKQLYSDIDYPAANMSMESGEIQSEATLDDVVTEIERNTLYDVREDKVIDAQEKHTQNPAYEIPTTPKKYKIPKLKGMSSETPDLPKTVCKLKENNTQTREYYEKSKLFDSKKTRQDQSENITFESEYVERNTDLPAETSSHVAQRILTSREIIEGDLELSDDPTDLVVKPKVNPKKVSNSKDVHKELKKNNKIEIIDNVDVKDQECSENITTDSKLSIHVEVERTLTEPDDTVPETNKNKKKKTKRKTHKDNATTPKESQTAEVEKIVDKKKRSKKEKETKMKDLKPKFCDLFGDSSTVDLITPDDLGIPSKEPHSQYSKNYVPIFEDAQDAIDVNVDEIESSLPKVDNKIADVFSSINAAEELKFERSKTKKVCPESTKKKTNKSEEAEAVQTDETIKTAYKNLNIEPLYKEPDIIKTLIISTGIQPQAVYDTNIGSNVELINNNLVDKIDKPGQQNVLLSKLQEVPIQALATSTPHKNLLIMNNVDTDTRIAESNCNTDESNSVRNDASSTIDQSSASNGLDSHDNADVPDVRIYVRRRRKVVKK